MGEAIAKEADMLLALSHAHGNRWRYMSGERIWWQKGWEARYE